MVSLSHQLQLLYSIFFKKYFFYIFGTYFLQFLRSFLIGIMKILCTIILILLLMTKLISSVHLKIMPFMQNLMLSWLLVFFYIKIIKSVKRLVVVAIILLQLIFRELECNSQYHKSQIYGTGGN